MGELQSGTDPRFQQNAMLAFARIGAVVLLLGWCFRIIAPFVNVVVWALIIAVALYPLHLKIVGWLGGRAKLSAALIVLFGLALLLIPTLMVAESSADFVKTLGEQLKHGAIDIPPPAPGVQEWPLIGKKAFALWSEASQNMESTLNRFGPQLIKVGTALLGMIGHGAMTVLLFVVALLIAGAFLLSADGGYTLCCRVAGSLAGSRGKDLVDLAIATIRSVVKGVLGVAIIQGAMAQIVLMLWGVPGAGIWAGLVLALAIMQLPPILIMGPVAVWVFSTSEPLSAIVFLVLAFLVSISDTFLKPLFLGRGMEIPMLVVLLGAIGGAVSFGIIGLFVGSVVLALGYTIVSEWIRFQAEAP